MLDKCFSLVKCSICLLSVTQRSMEVISESCGKQASVLTGLMRKPFKISVLQVINGAVLQQVFVVEYIVQSQMCEDCHRIEAKDFWKAVVQVRQKVGDKLNFHSLMAEQSGGQIFG